MSGGSYLVELHHLLGVHLLALVERGELDLLWRQSFICERPLDCVEIMGANRDETTLPCKILV